MFAALTLLIHETTDALRSRPEPSPPATPEAYTRLVVSGLGSPGKARLVAALETRLRGTPIAVSVSRGHPDRAPNLLHVHAETDLEAMVEGGLESAPRDSASAALVVPVDWEPLEHSVRRILDVVVAADPRGAELER